MDGAVMTELFVLAVLAVDAVLVVLEIVALRDRVRPRIVDDRLDTSDVVDADRTGPSLLLAVWLLWRLPSVATMACAAAAAAGTAVGGLDAVRRSPVFLRAQVHRSGSMWQGHVVA